MSVEIIEQLEILHIANGHIKWCDHLETSIAISHKIKYTHSIWPSNSIASYLLKENENAHAEFCIQISRAGHSEQPRSGNDTDYQVVNDGVLALAW